MNFVKLNANEDVASGYFMTIMAQAVTRGILDDDNSVILYGEHAGYKVFVMGQIPTPVMLQSDSVVDSIDETEISFGLGVEDPEGNTTLYVPDIKDSKVIWKKQS